MGVLERSLNEERCLCWRMKEEEGIFFGIYCTGVAHDRACGGTGRANSL